MNKPCNDSVTVRHIHDLYSLSRSNVLSSQVSVLVRLSHATWTWRSTQFHLSMGLQMYEATTIRQ